YDAKELNASNGIYYAATKTYQPDWSKNTGNGFSIQKDVDYNIIKTIHMVQEAAKKFGVEKEVRFFASSWTPPGFMKEETNASKSYKNNDLLIKGGALKDSAIDDLAMYYTRYLEEYAKQGITLYAMTLQNEPMLEIDYPSCAMSGEQEGKLAVAIKKAVAGSSVLSEEQKKVKLWAFDHNPSDAYSYVSKILSQPGANEALDGIAFHDYSGSLTNMQKVLDELLNKNGVTSQTVNLTERSVWGTQGANSIITYLRNSAVSYNSWVTMLDSNVGVHHWVGTPDPTMFARAAGSDNDYWAMPEFYISGQFSRFIRPGDVRVDSNLGSNDTVSNVVFMNPTTKTLKAVVVNASKQKQNFKIVCEGTQIIGALPAGNIGTYVWDMPKNIQEDLENGFLAEKYSKASDGVSVHTEDTESYITMHDGDYAEYVVDVPTAGAFQIRLEEKPTQDNQSISIYQGDTLATTIQATKTWDSRKVVVQGQILFAKPGVQSFRVKLSEGLQIYRISLIQTKETHSIPGKMKASDYLKMDGSATIDNGSELGNMSSYNTIYYKIHVPEADTYTFTMSAATENTDNVGFWLKLYDTSYNQIGGDILAKGNGGAFSYLGENGFNVSGSWTNFVTTSGDVSLPAGDYILGFTTGGAGININWISLGAYADLVAPVILEGAEDSQSLTLSVVGGIVADTTVASESAICIVNNLPEGVSYQAQRVDDTNYQIKLVGNRGTDFDTDQEVEVKLLIKQKSGAYAYSINYFVIRADKDSEELVVPEQDCHVVTLGGTKEFLLDLTGGTFIADKIAGISLAGDATAYYSLTNVQWMSPTRVKLVLSYNKKFYKEAELIIELPKDAYADATGGDALQASIHCLPEEGIPEVCIPVSQDKATVFDETMAYANKGSLKQSVQAGNFTDYFLDVAASGEYDITYTFQTETADGTSYANAWELNRGVAGEYYSTNSYKQVSIPGLWTNATVQMRQKIELSAGKQTLELKAKSGGYKISSIEIAPLYQVDLTGMKVGEEKIVPFKQFSDAEKNYVILGDNVEYTVDGTALDYHIKVAEAGDYAVSATYAIESASGVTAKISKAENGTETTLGTLDLPATTSWSKYAPSEAKTISLPKGEYTLRFALGKDGANLKSFELTFQKKEDNKPDPNQPDPDQPGSDGTSIYAPVITSPDGKPVTVNTERITQEVKDKTATIGCEISQATLLREAIGATKQNPKQINIEVPAKEILAQIKASKVKKVAVKIKIPSLLEAADNLKLHSLEVGEEILQAGKEEAKSLTFTITDEKGRERYQVQFDGKKLKKSKRAVEAINLSMETSDLSKDEEILSALGKSLREEEKQKGVVLDFGQEGLFPATAEVRINLHDISTMENREVYVYAVDQKLNSIASTKRLVGEDGTITFAANYGSKYVILPQEADKEIVSTLFERTQVVNRETLKVGDSKRLEVSLPVDAQEAATLSFKSADPSIVRVSKRGNVRIVKKGTAVITVKMKLEGKTKTYRVKVKGK
ncbi:MAG: hypothetical protein PWP24_92, partial [Clostridiales bacterium]|nr:hypothetical protein [Clostridiales bacterium]